MAIDKNALRYRHISGRYIYIYMYLTYFACTGVQFNVTNFNFVRKQSHVWILSRYPFFHILIHFRILPKFVCQFLQADTGFE